MKNLVLKLGLLAGTTGALLFTAACAAPATGDQPSGGFDYVSLALIGVMIVAFYFLMIRPQQKRQKAQAQLLSDLKKGEKIITAGGMFGTIESVNDETIVVRVESGAEIRMLKSSVMVKRD